MEPSVPKLPLLSALELKCSEDVTQWDVAGSRGRWWLMGAGKRESTSQRLCLYHNQEVCPS